MPKRRTILLACGLMAIAAAILVATSPDPEPSYRGRSLREWVSNAEWHQPQATQEEAKEAIRHIGSNAVPYLLKAIDYEPTAWNQALRTWFSQRSSGPLMPVETWLFSSSRSADAATKAFMHLGPQAQCAVPQLIGLLNHPKSYETASRAAAILGSIGRSVLPSQWCRGGVDGF